MFVPVHHTIRRTEFLSQQGLSFRSSLCTTQFHTKNSPFQLRNGLLSSIKGLTNVHFVRVSAFAAVLVQAVDLVHFLFAKLEAENVEVFFDA